MTGSHEPNDTTKAAIEESEEISAKTLEQLDKAAENVKAGKVSKPIALPEKPKSSKVNRLRCYRLVSGEYIVGEILADRRGRVKLLDPMFYGIQSNQLGVRTMVPGAAPRDPANVVTIRRDHIMCDMPPANCNIMEVYCKATHRAFATNEIGERVEVEEEEFSTQETDKKKTKAKKVRPPK